MALTDLSPLSALKGTVAMGTIMGIGVVMARDLKGFSMVKADLYV